MPQTAVYFSVSFIRKERDLNSIYSGRHDDIFCATGGNYSQTGDFSVFNMALDGVWKWRWHFEVRRPVLRPGGQQPDLFSVPLHQHQLQRGHARAAVVHVGNPIAVFGPKPDEALIS